MPDDPVFAEQLPDELYERITALSEEGNELLEDGHAERALAVWQEALDLLPEPKARWEAALWLYASLGDAWRVLGNAQEAFESFRLASRSAGMAGATNPFVLWGMGVSLHDLGRLEEAVDPLLRAYEMEGEEVFDAAEPRYLDFLRQQGLIDN